MLVLLGRHNVLRIGPSKKGEARVFGVMFSIRKERGGVYPIMLQIWCIYSTMSLYQPLSSLLLLNPTRSTMVHSTSQMTKMMMAFLSITDAILLVRCVWMTMNGSRPPSMNTPMLVYVILYRTVGSPLLTERFHGGMIKYLFLVRRVRRERDRRISLMVDAGNGCGRMLLNPLVSNMFRKLVWNSVVVRHWVPIEYDNEVAPSPCSKISLRFVFFNSFLFFFSFFWGKTRYLFCCLFFPLVSSVVPSAYHCYHFAPSYFVIAVTEFGFSPSYTHHAFIMHMKISLAYYFIFLGSLQYRAWF